MRRIENNNQKVDILSKIIFVNIYSNHKVNADDFVEEADRIVELIDGLNDVDLIAQVIERYYEESNRDDYWTNYEEVSLVIAKDYLNRIKKLA